MSNINVNNLTPLLGSGSSVSVSGSLVVKNDVTIGGHLYIGDQDTDSVTFSAEVSSSVVPDANITYDLGSSAKRWNTIYLNSLVTHHITASGNISASGTGINGTGSFHHVTVNGNVTSSGTASFEGGFFSTNGTGSLAYATISGDMDIAGHISGSRISASAGLEVDHTGSFRYISSSGDLTASGTGSFGGGIDSSTATGSFGQVTAQGDISSSATGSFMDLFVDDNAEIQGFVSVSGDLGVTGDVSSSGRISASAGFETDAGTTSNFGTISSSGNLIISGHVSASRVSASAGFEADSDSKSTFGHISMSGDLQVGNNTVVISGSIGEITASGNISGGAQILGGDYYAQGIQFATQADGGSSGVLQIGGSNPMRITGPALMVTGSISMSGALSMSGANSDLTIDAGNIVVNNGSISTITGAISSSEHLIGNLIQQHTAGVTNFAVDALGQVTASGQISSSAGLAGTALTLTTAGVHKASIDASGNIAAEGVISSSGTVATLRSLNIESNGVVSLNIHGSGTVSSSAGLIGNSIQQREAGVTNFAVDVLGQVTASGQISSSAGLAGTSLDIRTAGVQKAAIDANGTGSFFGGIDSPGATGSFGFISCSGDISGTANIHLGSQIIGPGNVAQLEMSATNLSLGHSTTVTGLSGTQLNLNASTNGITVTGSISASHAFDTVGSGSFGGGLTNTGNIHSTGQVYAPFYRNYHTVTNDQVLTATSSGVPIVCTNDVAVTLPAVAIGVSFWIINGNADGTKITVSPDANDKFLINAAGASGTDDKDCINTAATARKGDYLKITYGSGDGWTILERAGVWADQS